ncbi:hypothetical protein RvY_05813-1 [Ramazzottius varieornatus]|uniref:G-protein coupled receptors family 1 profile domain-containing protein n=1 Tax=Ramazzottius varieornatus TaxID=947166 RepID=A0A1D1V1Y4_RAMVA|nr:hypothetical protein RvY_05813-1 [Ramazzottius varieornatus]
MRRMHRSVTNIFLLNVAVSDILITVLNIPFNLVRVLSEEWPFGSLMCSVIPFIQVAAVYSASWTMVCIAVDRLIVTVYPLRPRMPIHTGIALVILVWTFSILGALPYALIHQTVTAISFTTSIRCIAIFPPPEVTYRRYLSLITFLFQFCIPLSITGICYGKISQKLWFSHNFFSVNTGLLNGGFLSVQNAGLIIRNRQRSIKMLILVVVVFATCWLPISVYHLRRDFEDLNGPTSHSIFLFLLLHWTAMSSTCYSPFIYCCWNSCYRSQARIIYGFLCFCLPKTSAKELRQQVTIRGLVVRFRGNTRDTAGSDELGNPSQNGMKSFNWDSVVGTREMLSFHEGHRTYRTA